MQIYGEMVIFRYVISISAINDAVFVVKNLSTNHYCYIRVYSSVSGLNIYLQS